MAITYRPGRMTIQQGMTHADVWSFRTRDGKTQSLAGWSATFEVFNRDGASVLKYTSAAQPGYLAVGLWDPSKTFPYNVYLEIPAAVTSALVDWGIGHFDLDVIDRAGHVQYRVHDECVLERGTRHG